MGTRAGQISLCLPRLRPLQGIYSLQPNRVFGAYAYNGEPQVSPPRFDVGLVYLDGGIAADKNLQPSRPIAVLAPRRMIAIGDSTIAPGEGVSGPAGAVLGMPVAPIFTAYFIVRPEFPLSSSLSRAKRAMLRRHQKMWNMLFVDGHVESKHPRNYFDVRSDEVLSLWNRDNRARRQ